MQRKEKNGLYIALISIHGLIRGNDLELGCDPDTGGQTRYVRDLADVLGQHKEVGRVDLITQRIEDEAVSEDYAQTVEPLNEHTQIVRINIGTEGYIRKEELWEYLDIFADNLLAFFQEQDRFPNILHSHYADAGFVGARLTSLSGIPLVHQDIRWAGIKGSVCLRQVCKRRRLSPAIISPGELRRKRRCWQLRNWWLPVPAMRLKISMSSMIFTIRIGWWLSLLVRISMNFTHPILTKSPPF